MRESDESFSVNLHEIEPTVSLVGGRVFIGIREHEIAPGVIIREADVEIEDSETTVDELIRTDELKNQAARLLRLRAAITTEAVSHYLNQVLETVYSNASSYFFFTEGEQLFVEAVVADITLVAKVFLLPAKDGRLRVVIDEELWFGVTPVRSFTKELYDVLHRALQSPIGLFATIKLSGPCELHFDVVNALSWALFPAQGWKLPLHRELNIVSTHITDSGQVELIAISDLAPRQFQVPRSNDTSTSPSVVKLLARQDTVRSIPNDVFMLAGDTYAHACQKLFDAIPVRASSALVERLMIVGLADSSTHALCKEINARDLLTRPASLPGLLCRAILSELEGDDEQAIADYVEVADLGTGRIAAHAYRRAALAAAEIDAQRSLNFLEYAISLAPEHLGIKIDFAQAQAEAGQHAQAVNLLTQLLSTENIRPTARVSMLIQMGSWLLFELEDLSAAKECYEKALAIDSEHPDASLGLAQVLERSHEYQKAAEIFERLLADAIECDDMERASTLCMFLGDMWAPSEPEAALQRFQKALELDPNNESAKIRVDQFLVPSAPVEQIEPDNELEALLSLAAAAHATPDLSAAREKTTSEILTEDISHHDESISKICDAIVSRDSIENLCEQIDEVLPQLSHDSRRKLRHEIQASFQKTRDFNSHIVLLKQILGKAHDAEEKSQILVEIAAIERRHLHDYVSAERNLTEALGYVPNDIGIQESLTELFNASDRFDSIFDTLGEEVFKEHLEGMLSLRPQPTQKILDAARVLASSMETAYRGRFYFELAGRFDAVGPKCTAIFESSHFEDVSKSELLRFLSKIDVKGNEEDRASVLRTSLALEDDLDRRVEIRMALGECLAAQKIRSKEQAKSKPEAVLTPDVVSTEKQHSGAELQDESKNEIKVSEYFEELISATQLEQLVLRVERLLEENKRAWAIGPGAIVTAATGLEFDRSLAISSIRNLSLPHIQRISDFELDSPLGRLLSVYGSDMNSILPTARDDALVEMDEVGSDSELQNLCDQLSSLYETEFRLVVDLRSDARARLLNMTLPSICLPAELLKNATLAQLRFEIGKWLTYLRLGGLVYAAEPKPEKVREWIELFYGVLNSDVLDTIPYEYATHVDTLRQILSDNQKNEILDITGKYSLENLLSDANTWPRVALRTAIRTGYLLSPTLQDVMPLLQDEELSVQEDLLDFLLSEGFVRILQDNLE